MPTVQSCADQASGSVVIAQVKLKPEAKKVEIKVPIDHGPGLVNFDDDAEDAIQLEELTLSSTHV